MFRVPTCGLLLNLANLISPHPTLHFNSRIAFFVTGGFSIGFEYNKYLYTKQRARLGEVGDSGIKSCLGPEWSLKGDLQFLCEISPDFDSQRDFFFSVKLFTSITVD